MKITVHGAAGEVTVSAYLIETDRARILIDLGMFQGSSEQDPKNVLPSGLLSKPLDAVLLTHAHLDHVGRLPLLAKAGYTGEIYATGATRELAGLILRDSAKVQAYEVERRNRKRHDNKPPLEPLYIQDDVEQTLQFFRNVDYERPFSPAQGVSARYVDAGHMLGSASIELTIQEIHKTWIVVFSGDIGPAGEDNDPGFVIFLNGKFDAGRAEHVAGIDVASGDALCGTEWALVIDIAEELEGLFDVVLNVERLQRRFVIVPFTVASFNFVGLDFRGIAQDKAREFTRSAGGVDLAGVTGFGEKRQAADMIEMG